MYVGRCEDIKKHAIAELSKGKGEKMENVVRRIYEPFTADQISKRISELVMPDIAWKGDVEIIYQGIDDLHAAIPNNSGDWYFTGNYPTPGGVAIANKAFISYMNNHSARPGDNFQLNLTTTS